MSPLGRKGHCAQRKGRTRRFRPRPGAMNPSPRGLVPRPATRGLEDRVTYSRTQQASVPTDSLQSPRDLAQEVHPAQNPRRESSPSHRPNQGGQCTRKPRRAQSGSPLLSEPPLWMASVRLFNQHPLLAIAPGADGPIARPGHMALRTTYTMQVALLRTS